MPPRKSRRTAAKVASPEPQPRARRGRPRKNTEPDESVEKLSSARRNKGSIVETQVISSGDKGPGGVGHVEMDDFESIARATFVLLPKQYREATMKLDIDAKNRRKAAKKRAADIAAKEALAQQKSTRTKRRSTRKIDPMNAYNDSDEENMDKDDQEYENDDPTDDSDDESDEEESVRERRRRKKGDARQPLSIISATKRTVYPFTEGVNVNNFSAYIDSTKTGKSKRSSKTDTANIEYWLKHNKDTAFPTLLDGKETENLTKIRQFLMQSTWNNISKWHDEQSVKLNSVAFSSIHKCIGAAHETTLRQKKLDTSRKGKKSTIKRTLLDPTSPEIPTCVVFSGVNLSDSETLFLKFMNKLKDEKVHATAILPSYSSLTLKLAARIIIEQFTSTDYVNLDNSNIPEASKGSSKMATYDFSILESWYSRSNLKGNLVLFVPDFEGFDGKVLCELLSILSNYIQKLPIVLVFGVATSMEALHQTFSKNEMESLCIEKFWLQHSNTLVNELVNDLIIDADGPLNMGLDSYELLLNRYQLYNYSIDSLLMSIHYSSIDTYYSSPLSFLFQEYILNRNPKVLESLTHFHYREVRMMRSFRVYIDGQVEANPDLVADLLFDDESTLDFIKASMIEIYEYKFKVQVLMKCLLAMQDTLANPSFVRPSRTIFISVLSGSLMESEYISIIFKFISKRPFKEFYNLIETIIDIHKESRETYSSKAQYFQGEISSMKEALKPETTLMQYLDDQIERFEGFRKELEECSEGKRLLRDDGEGFKEEDSGSQMQSIEDLIGVNGGFSSIAGKSMNCLNVLMRDNIYTYRDITLHECVFYANSSRVQKSFHPRPRAAIQTALENTQHYIQAGALQSENSKTNVISSALPDVAICYRIYLEGSKLINVFDWFMAFCAIASNGAVDVMEEVERYKTKTTESMKATSHDNPEEVTPTISRAVRQLQARFIKSVAELQFVGFIKPQTKMDYVSRLTWGHL